MTSFASPAASFSATDQPTAHAARSRGDALLSAEEERTLAAAIARGDADAHARMAHANLRLVVAIARQYLGSGLDLDDLIGEGNLGLLRAVAEFDPGRGVRFGTYAAWWIRQAIRAALTDTAWTVRVPSHMSRQLRDWRRAERALECELGEAATFGQVADRLGLSAGQRELIRGALRARRLRAGAGAGEGPPEAASGGEGPEAAAERSDASRDLRARMAARLEPREREVIELRFGLGGGNPLTLKEVGRRLGITREWARKVEIRAVAKLRDDDDA
jgi:RNA polymerase primary sigma factor